jgi:hypothetical protein
MSEPPGWASPGPGPQPPSSENPRPQPEAGAVPPPPAGSGQPGRWGAEPGWGSPQPQWGGAPAGWGGAPAGWGGQPGWGQPPAAEPKPGVIPLRPLGLGELLDGAIAIVRTYPRVTLGLSAVVMTVTQLIQLAITASFAPDFSTLSTDVTTGATDTGAVTSLLGSLAVLVTASVIVSGLGLLVLTGMLTIVVGKAVLGEPITTGEAWRELRGQLPGLLAVTLLTFLILFGLVVGCLLPAVLAAIFGVPGGFIGLLIGLGLLVAAGLVITAYVQLSLATPALILERATVRGALSRSRLLVRHSWWRVAGILVLAAIVAAALNGILSVPFQLFGGGSPFQMLSPDRHLGFGALLISALGAILVGTIVQPFTAGVRALLYVDRRMRAEGLDVTLAQAANRRGTPVA